MKENIVYEQPLNERVRTFLRIEHLFDTAAHFLAGESTRDSRACLDSLLQIIDLLARTDIKTELVKELERHASTLAALRTNPGVDPQRLEAVMNELSQYLETLRDTSCQPGKQLRNDELISSIRQRNAIPGGTCSFDLPAYHFWLGKPAQERRNDLDSWLKDLQIIRKSMKMSLQMIRNSATPSRERADGGFYQRPIEPGVSCQMIRVILPRDSKYHPEISGGRHRFTVRFLHYGPDANRPAQTDDTVEFELHCCIL